jgi:hypothetical protein
LVENDLLFGRSGLIDGIASGKQQGNQHHQSDEAYGSSFVHIVLSLLILFNPAQTECQVKARKLYYAIFHT